MPYKEQKNHQKMSEFVQIPDNDLCSQFNKLDLKMSKSSENNIFSEESHLPNIKDNFNDNIDAINNIEEKFSNIKIVNENDVFTKSEKLKNTEQVFNILCDHLQDENVSKEDQFPGSTDDQVDLDDNDNNEHEKPCVHEALKTQNIEEKDNACDISSHLNCEIQKEEKDIEVNENRNEILSESKKSDKNDKGLCSRGPVFVPRHSQSSYQPYDNGTWINSTNSQSVFLCGGEVLQVAEPLAQSASACQQWNDFPDFNVIQNELEELVRHTCPVSLSPPLASVAPDSPETPVSPVAPTTQPSITALKGLAPVDQIDQTSLSTVFDENDNNTLDLIWNIYVNNPQIRSAWDKEIAMWDRASQPKTDGPKYHPILPKPAIAASKSRFRKILDPERKKQVWPKIKSLQDDVFLKGDQDGDTQLMIVVSNEHEGQLEIIYAMVERMREIPGALNKENNNGQSALYLACKLLHKQPLVAAYIAEALLEQNVNIANLRYENGLTLPEILENEGETHDAVLKELLAVKDSCGRFAFPMNHQNEFCYKETPEKNLNLSNWLREEFVD